MRVIQARASPPRHGFTYNDIDRMNLEASYLGSQCADTGMRPVCGETTMVMSLISRYYYSNAEADNNNINASLPDLPWLVLTRP